jgi:hypothetical protein
MRIVGLGISLLVSISCGEGARQVDSESDLLRTPEAITEMRMSTLAKWIGDSVRSSGQMHLSLTNLTRADTVGVGPTDDPYNDAWGTPIVFTRVGSGFQLQSAGRDRLSGNADDIYLRVLDPAAYR